MVMHTARAPRQRTPKPPRIGTCPFCGGKHEIEGSDLSFWQVICTGCGARTGLYEEEALAIAAWNRRPIPGSP
jgi:Lar family restriction alleviation protein